MKEKGPENWGWVKLHRKSLFSSVFKDETVWKVWCWCLMRANHGDENVYIGGQDLTVRSGQFITGRHKATQELSTSDSKYRRALTYLISTSRITSKTTNHYSLITVVNWEKYQHIEERTTSRITSKTTNEQPTTNQQTDHKQEVKNEKNLGETKVSQIITIETESEPLEKRKSTAKYPNARTAFSWFPRPQKSWAINTTELAHGELLFERGEEKVKGILRFVAKHRDDEFFPKVTKPSDLERKWEDIAAFKP